MSPKVSRPSSICCAITPSIGVCCDYSPGAHSLEQRPLPRRVYTGLGTGSDQLLLHSKTPDCNFGQNRLFIALNAVVSREWAVGSEAPDFLEIVMLSAEQNDRITRVGPDKPAGQVLRRYWQPAALVDELSGNRPIKAVKRSSRTWTSVSWD